jgi:hypothetical protein
MRLRVSGEKIWTAKVHPPRSTDEASLWSPLFVPHLAVFGGSRIERATLEWSGFIRLDQRHLGEFQSPLAILPLMGEGGSGMVWRVKWDPSPVMSPTMSCFPSRHLYSTQPHNRAVPNGHLLTL